jgi:hypothetical protein
MDSKGDVTVEVGHTVGVVEGSNVFWSVRKYCTGNADCGDAFGAVAISIRCRYAQAVSFFVVTCKLLKADDNVVDALG